MGSNSGAGKKTHAIKCPLNCIPVPNKKPMFSSNLLNFACGSSRGQLVHIITELPASFDQLQDLISCMRACNIWVVLGTSVNLNTSNWFHPSFDCNIETLLTKENPGSVQSLINNNSYDFWQHRKPCRVYWRKRILCSISESILSRRTSENFLQNYFRCRNNYNLPYQQIP